MKTFRKGLNASDVPRHLVEIDREDEACPPIKAKIAWREALPVDLFRFLLLALFLAHSAQRPARRQSCRTWRVAGLRPTAHRPTPAGTWLPPRPAAAGCAEDCRGRKRLHKTWPSSPRRTRQTPSPRRRSSPLLLRPGPGVRTPCPSITSGHSQIHRQGPSPYPHERCGLPVEGMPTL